MVNLCKKIMVLWIIALLCPLAWGETWVVDNAQVLDHVSKSQIEESLSQINAKYGNKSFIVTLRTIRQPEQMVADDLFDQMTHYYAGQNIEGTLLLVVTEDAAGQGRRVSLSTSGNKTIDRLDNSTVNKLLNQFAADMQRSNNYNTALKNYVIALDPKLADNALSATDAAGGGLAGLLSGLLAFFRTKKRYRMPRRPLPAVWKNNTVSTVAHSHNELIDSQTRIRIIPTPPKNVGGSGVSHTHYSSSGNRHGGGSRSF